MFVLSASHSGSAVYCFTQDWNVLSNLPMQNGTRWNVYTSVFFSYSFVNALFLLSTEDNFICFKQTELHAFFYYFWALSNLSVSSSQSTGDYVQPIRTVKAKYQMFVLPRWATLRPFEWFSKHRHQSVNQIKSDFVFYWLKKQHICFARLEHH